MEQSTDRRSRFVSQPFELWLVAITVAALVLRVTVTLVTRGFDKASASDGDGFYYSTVANHLAAGHWFVNPFTGAPTADHPPMTVLVLAPASWLFDSTLAQRLTMVLVGTVTVFVIGLVGRRIGGNRVGIVAAAVAMLNPNLWINDSLTMSDSLAALFVALLIWCGLVLVDQPRTSRALLNGAVLGVALLVRAELGWFFVFMVVPVLLTVPAVSRPHRVRLMATVAGCAIVIVAPWTAWNATRFAEPVWLSNNAGHAIAGSNCDSTYRGDLIGVWDPQCAIAQDRPNRDDSQNASRGLRAGLTYVREHLGRLPLVLLAREGRMFGIWQPRTEVDMTVSEGRPRLASWAGLITFWLLVAPSIGGAVILIRRLGRVRMWPFIACLACPLLTAAAFYGAPRFRIPLDVATCLLAAVPIAQWSRLRAADERRRGQRLDAPSGIPEPGPERPATKSQERISS